MFFSLPMVIGNMYLDSKLLPDASVETHLNLAGVTGYYIGHTGGATSTQTIEGYISDVFLVEVNCCPYSIWTSIFAGWGPLDLVRSNL